MIARLAAIRLLPIRSRYSRYDNQPTTSAVAIATMPLPTVRISIAVPIENVRSFGAIFQTITRTMRDHLMQDCRSVAIAVPIENVRSFGAIFQTITRTMRDHLMQDCRSVATSA